MGVPDPIEARADPKILLAAEVGPNVRIAAFGEAEDGPRLLSIGESESTHAAPYFDAAVGFNQARSRLRAQIGNLDGVEDSDRYVVTGSGLGHAAGVALISNLTADSHKSVIGLLTSHDFEIAAQFHAPNKKLAKQFDPEELARQLLTARAPIVVVALANDRGWENLATAVDILRYAVVGRIPGYSPAIILIHYEDLEPGMLATLINEFNFVQLSMKAGFDAPDLPQVRTQFADAYEAVVTRQANPIMPEHFDENATVPLRKALGTAAHAMAVNGGISVAVLHAEPRGASVAISDGREMHTASFGFDTNDAAAGHVGLRLPMAEVLEWIPPVISESMAEEYFKNRAWRPWLLPETSVELLLDHTAAHLALRRAMRSLADPSPPIDLIVCTGRTLSGAPRLVQAALCGINGYMPGGYCQLAVDRPGLLAICGALIAAGSNISAEPYLVHVATALSCGGNARFGSAALGVEVTPHDGEPISRSVSFGAMERITWDAATTATVKSWPGGKLDAGGGRGRATALRNDITPGIGGLIIDARGRPLEWPADDSLRKAALLQWFQSTDSYVLPSQTLDWDGVDG